MRPSLAAGLIVASTVAAGAQTSSQPPSATTVIYTLTSQPGVDLSAHIGHTVEVSGIEPQAKQTASTTGQSRRSTPATVASPTPTSEIVARRMRVSAVKMVATDCQIRR